jgi:hypothetical protein
MNGPVSPSTSRAVGNRRRRWVLSAVASLLVIAGCLSAGLLSAPLASGAAPHAASSLDVQPFPDTPDASPQTQIAFPALARSELSAVSVNGSLSGPHAGRLVALSGGHGTAFVPDRPFTNGERVTVRAALSSAGAGTASGAPNAIRISFGFWVRAAVQIANVARFQSAVRHDIRDPGGITHTFHSINSIHPPVVTRSGTDPDPSQGYILGDAQN